MINVKVQMNLFYGYPISSKRKYSCDILKQLHVGVGFPWFVFGDFKKVLQYQELTSVNNTRKKVIQRFSEAFEKCNLLDLSYEGPCFTYSSHHKGNDEFKARLDRVLVCE